MYQIELSNFTMAFAVKADRDSFQAILNQAVPQIVKDNNLLTRIPPAAGKGITDEAVERGYQWFDADTYDAVWASRATVGFGDKKECEIFHNALTEKFGTSSANLAVKASTTVSDLNVKDGKTAMLEAPAVYSLYVDKSGKSGAFNRDSMVVKEPADNTQMDIK